MPAGPVARGITAAAHGQARRPAVKIARGLTSHSRGSRPCRTNPARFFNRLDSLGTVEKGKLADLVLLDANPLDDINNTRRISAVVADGRYFPQEALRKIFADVEAAAKKQ